MIQLPVYNTDKRPDLPVIDTEHYISNISKAEALKKDLIWIICQNLHCNHQTVNSWTGLNIRVCQGMEMLQDQVGYLPTIDAPPTLMNTVYEILKKALEVKDALNLQSIVIALNQAIYAKALEIIWKHQFLQLYFRAFFFEWELFIPQGCFR